MDMELKNKCDLLVINRKAMAETFALDSSYMTYAAALLLTSEGIEIDKEHAKRCMQIIRDNTGMFSEFRGNIMHPMICKLMLCDNPEGYFGKIKKAVSSFRKIKWIGNEYRILAAMVVCDHANEEEYDIYVDKTMELYQKMKEQHSILTGAEDIPFAAILATSGIDTDMLVTDMEEAFKILKTKFHDGDAVQSLSHVLCLDGRPVEEKCSRVMKIFDECKALKHKYGTGYELASLGTLSMLDMSEKQIAEYIAEADDYLKKQKGFGDFVLGSKERRLFAAQVVLQTYGDKDMSANSVVISSMLALTIALEVCMLVCMTACITTTTTD